VEAAGQHLVDRGVVGDHRSTTSSNRALASSPGTAGRPAESLYRLADTDTHLSMHDRAKWLPLAGS
jgi:hypothetical protein